MTVVDFVRLTRANLAVIFAMFSVGLIGAFGYTLRQPVVYSACSQGTVIVASDQSVSGIFSANSLALQRLPTYVQLANNTRVAQDVIAKLDLQATPGEIAGRFSAAAAAATPDLTICASAPSARDAADLANAVVGAMSKEAAALESAARPAGSSTNNLIRLVPTEQAGVPGAPSSPNYLRNLLAGGLVGIVVGYAVALIRRQLDRKVRTVEDVETLMGTSVLSIVPESDELDRATAVGLLESQTGPAAESLRQLRTNLRFVDVDKPPRSIVLTSANAGEGKSVVVANLARVLAAAGQPTVLIDGDLRRPMVASIFGLEPAVGLTQVLAGDVALREVMVDAGVPNLKAIGAGRIPPNPSELLGSQRMQALIRELVDAGYYVLIDAPPLLPVTDAGLLAATVDGTLLVLAVGRTYKEQARLSAKVLGQVGGHLLGAVMNRAPLKGIGSVVYGYGYSTYGSDYYSGYASLPSARPSEAVPATTAVPLPRSESDAPALAPTAPVPAVVARAGADLPRPAANVGRPVRQPPPPPTRQPSSWPRSDGAGDSRGKRRAG